MERSEIAWYEQLGLSPGAAAEQVERAYRFYRDLYRDDSLATYSLLSPEELRAARRRVEEAYEMLRDPGRRDAEAPLGPLAAVPPAAPPAAPQPIVELVSLPPPPVALVEVAPAPGSSAEDVPPAITAPPVSLPAAPPAPPTNPEPPPLPDPVTGAALKAYRLAKGVALRDIANQSKIGMRFLEYIEADRFRDLPAAVYVRGFLREYARGCGLDPARIIDSYLSRFEE